MRKALPSVLRMQYSPGRLVGSRAGSGEAGESGGERGGGGANGRAIAHSPCSTHNHKMAFKQADHSKLLIPGPIEVTDQV